MDHKLRHCANACSHASHNKQHRLGFTYHMNFFSARSPGQSWSVTLLCRIFTVPFFLLPFSSYAQTIAAGGWHSLAICSDSSVRDWGNNSFGQLGSGNNSPTSDVPLPVLSLTGISAIAAGGGQSLALKIDGTVWAWGWNAGGQLGNGTNTDSNVPVPVSSLTDIIDIAAGSGHSLALKKDGTVWAWGLNGYGQLGNGTYANSSLPVQVSSLKGIIDIAAGLGHSLALKTDGTVWAWGWNGYGQLGNPDANGDANGEPNSPVQVNSLTGVTAIAGGSQHTLALKNEGTVWAFGAYDHGQLGIGSFIPGSDIPVPVSFLTSVTAIAGGGAHSHALKSDGTVWSWGSQLGSEGNTLGSYIPVHVNSLTGITAIAAGAAHCIALNTDGTVFAWGSNDQGQLGNGTKISSKVPVRVIGLDQVLSSAIENGEIPGVFALLQNYPNPFNPSTTVSYAIPRSAHVSLRIYNALGQEVASIVNERKEAGYYQATWNANVPSGIYFYRLSAVPSARRDPVPTGELNGQAGDASTSSSRGFVETK